MSTLAEVPVSTSVATVWLQVVNTLLVIREAHEEGGEVSGECWDYSWNFDAPKGLITLQLSLDLYGGLQPDELHSLNYLREHNGSVQFIKGDEEGEVQVRIVARFLPELATEQALERAEQMLNGGTL